MRILLTGATGFLGSALARQWQSLGHELLLLARPTSSTRRIDDLLPQAQLERVSDVGQLPALFETFSPDAVVHTACSYARAGETLVEVLDANLRFGAALLQSLASTQERTPIFLNTGTVLKREVSLYALSKNQFSELGAAWAGRVQFIDARVQQMYGHGDDRSKFTTLVIEACRNNEPYLALTKGEQCRDMVHVDDVVQAYTLILEKRGTFESRDVIDVGSGVAARMRDFVELAKRLAQATTVLDFGAVDYRPNEAMHCVADTTRLRALGWLPHFDLESGLRHTLNQGNKQ